MQASFHTMLSAVSIQCTGIFSSLFSYNKLRRLQKTSNYQCELLNKIYLYCYSQTYLSCYWLLALHQRIPADKFIPALGWQQDVIQLINKVLFK